MFNHAFFTGASIHIRLSITFHLLHDSALVGAGGQEREHSVHAVLVVGVYNLVLLQWAKLKCLFAEVGFEVVVLLVQLSEFLLNDLDVLWVF